MDSDDGCSVGTASTDTSMLLKELQALNTGGTSGPLSASQTVTTETLKGLASGEDENPGTLPQALQTLRGDQPAQIVNFSEDTEESSVGIYGRKVEVYTSPVRNNLDDTTPGSNKVKVTPVVNHIWDHKYFHGNLISVHKDLEYVGYVLKVKTGGICRIVNRRTGSRFLLKCYNGDIMDVAFALSDDVYLATADETGTLFVHSFSMDGINIVSEVILHVERQTYNIESMFRNYTRVIWCPYMPDDDSEIGNGVCDVAKMLVLLHGTQAEVWNVDYVNQEHGNEPSTLNCQGAGMMCIDAYEPLMPVVNAAFAPDGSAIALAYFSGVVKFYLVNLIGPRDSTCMHEWVPHDGAPVNSLFFLDDHRHAVPGQQLWKFALTGAHYNTEIKIWSCETWDCVQVLRLNSPRVQPDLNIQLKSDIDLSSKYLVLSDIQSNILYILHLHQDIQLATAHISSVSKFSLTLPCISFAIFDASLKKLKRSPDDTHLDDITTGELEKDIEVKENGDTHASDGMERTTIVQVKMYSIHTKCLQELLIRYRPESSTETPPVPSISSLSQDEAGLRDTLSDMSFEQSLSSNDTSNIPQDLTQGFLGAAKQQMSNSSVPVQPSLFPTPPSSSSAEPVRAAAVSRDERVTSPVDHGNLPSAASSTSSFTYVTEDVMESPISSVDPSSIMSPSSAFSQTPQRLNANQSSNQLSAISSCDDDDDGSGDRQNETTSSRNSAGSGRDLRVGKEEAEEDEDEREIDLEEESPRPSEDDINLSNQNILNDIFTSSSWQKKVADTTVDSLESTTSSVTKQQPDRYDADDQEVAQALSSTLVSEGFGGPQPGEDDDDDDEEEEEEEVEEIFEVDLKEEKVDGSAEEKKKEAKWPDPPDVSIEAKRLVTEAIQQSTREEKTGFDGDDENDEAEIEEILETSSREGDNVYPETTEISPSLVMQNLVSEKAFANMDSKLSDLAEKMMQQQEMLMTMQKELAGQREVQLQLHRQQVEQQQLQQVASQQPSIQEDISKLEDILVSRMEHSLAQHMHKETQRLQDSLTKSDQQRVVRDKSLQTALLTEMSQAIRDNVSHTLKTEIKQTISPALHRSIEPMKEKIHQEVAQRLTACDSLLRDNIAKAVKSRSTMDVLANAVGDVIYQQMQQAYTHTFKASMLPSFSASMEKTVRDVHGVFQQGTKEYQHYLKQNSDFVMKERAKTEEIIKRMENAEQQFVQGMNHMKNLIVTSVKEELSGQVAQAVSSLRTDMISDIQRVVKDEINLAMKDHGASIDDKLTSYLRSAAATPVPGGHDDEVIVSKEKIIRDLRNGHIDEAFQSALSAENLDLVLYACEAVSPMNLFAISPCPLSQPVLLSLTSQLATNLEQQFDLKMKFLSDAVMSLDIGNSRTAEHIPPVLTALVRCLTSALRAFSSDPKKVKEIKMLIMAANSLVA